MTHVDRYLVPDLLAHDGPPRAVPDSQPVAAPDEPRYRRGRRSGATAQRLKNRREDGEPLALDVARFAMAREIAQDSHSGPEINPLKFQGLLRTKLLDVAIYGAPSVFPDVPHLPKGNPNWTKRK